MCNNSKEVSVQNGELTATGTGLVVSAREQHGELEDPFSDEFLANSSWLSLYGEDGTVYRQQVRIHIYIGSRNTFKVDTFCC